MSCHPERSEGPAVVSRPRQPHESSDKPNDRKTLQHKYGEGVHRGQHPSNAGQQESNPPKDVASTAKHEPNRS